MPKKNVNAHVHCAVTSCKHHDNSVNCCCLDTIDVNPCPDCHSGTPDETLCGSYECNQCR